ncbi:hypothetical protein, partial [Bacillus cereus]|uniref:hypothetical protein n=1 Tax=Bacillus cereus TaxID=1396 RepID=UPI0034D4304B
MALIKKTKNLSVMELPELFAVLQSCEIDNNQRRLNHAASYKAAGINLSSNTAFATQSIPYMSMP